MTLHHKGRAKALPLDRVRVTVGHKRDEGLPPDLFVREIRLTGALSDTQKERLLEIAGRCPVHRSLTNGARIETALDEAQPLPVVDKPTQHVLDTEEIGRAPV